MKILASDMDGTLVVNDEINPKDIQAIDKLKKEGHKLVVSTGRTLKGMDNIFQKYKVPYDYMVLCNGALIIDRDKKIIYRDSIKNEKIKKIIKAFEGKENIMMYMDDGESFYLIQNDNAKKNEIKFFDSINYTKISAQDALKLDQDFIMASVFATDREVFRAIEAKKILDEILDEKESCRNEFFVDIIASGCSKGKGLEQLLKIENKEIEDLYAIGDSFNDISMFELTKNSYTFNRVEDEVKKHAQNNVDYIYEVVDDILNKR